MNLRRPTSVFIAHDFALFSKIHWIYFSYEIFTIAFLKLNTITKNIDKIIRVFKNCFIFFNDFSVVR